VEKIYSSNPRILVEQGSPYRIFPLGDSAITIDFGNVVDEKINDRVISMLKKISSHPFAGFIEASPAYSSVTVFYDVYKIHNEIKCKSVFEWVKQKLEGLLLENISAESPGRPEIKRIPVCYESRYAIDLSTLAKTKNLPEQKIIQLHCSRLYRVYMLGFLPGFPYLGGLDERIAAPRKLQPQRVAAGSVGIAGVQTGIYPFDSPGGWQIIGRTPAKIFDHNNEQLSLLRAGDVLEFYPITTNEFENIKGRHS
jgi:inhibitor of KinA